MLQLGLQDLELTATNDDFSPSDALSRCGVHTDAIKNSNPFGNERPALRYSGVDSYQTSRSVDDVADIAERVQQVEKELQHLDSVEWLHITRSVKR